MVPVTVAITRYEEIDFPDPGSGETTYKFGVKIADFPRVDTGNVSFPPRGFGMAGLTFTRFVDSSNPIVPIEISVEDVDDFNPDDPIDINPRSGINKLTLEYDLNTLQWSESEGAFDFPTSVVEGNGDTDRGRLSFYIGPSSDTDGDGLFDIWETDGIDANYDDVIDLELNTNPEHKDLFVEVDAMQGMAPEPGAIADLVAAFGAAPQSLVQNPDELDGVTLHMQLDETNVPNEPWEFGFSEFDAIKANTDPNVAGGFGTTAERASDNAAAILKAKGWVYRYSIFANEVADRRIGAAELGTTSEAPLGGNDFWVALGELGGGTRDEQAGVFMHELGHALGLGHGGDQVSASRNYKPNYHSVMNYLWDVPYRLGPAPTAFEQAFANSWRLDYSRRAFNDLDENDLDEAAGIGGDPGNIVRLRDGRYLPEVGPIDWNGDGDSNDQGVVADVNGTGTQNFLTGSEDWSRLKYNFRNSYEYYNDPLPQDVDLDLTIFEYRDSINALVYAAGIGDGADDLTLRRSGDLFEVFDNLTAEVVASRAVDQTRLIEIIGTDNEDDTLTIDLSTGDFAPPGGIAYAGGDGGNDRLKVIGHAAANVAYAPSPTTPGAGMITTESGGNLHTISFTGLEPVEVSGFAGVDFTSAGSTDVLSLAAGLSFAGDPAYVLSGSSDAVPFESLTFFDAETFTLDAATNDGPTPGDTIDLTLNPGAGVGTLRIEGGAGSDVFSVAASPLAAAGPAPVIELAGMDESDIYAIDVDALAATVVIVDDSGAADEVVVTDSGDGKFVDYSIAGNAITTRFTAGGGRAFAGLTYPAGQMESLSLTGTTGANRFFVTPDETTTLTIHGNAPSFAGPGVDYLEVDFADTAGPKLTYSGPPSGNGVWEFLGDGVPVEGDRRPIHFTGIEKLNYFEILAAGAAAGFGRQPRVHVYDARSGELQLDFLAYSPSWWGGVRVATGDVTGDGIPEIITAPSGYHYPQVRVFDLMTGDQIYSFMASSPGFNTGIFVAVGDVNADGRNDIVVAREFGLPLVHVFENTGQANAPFQHYRPTTTPWFTKTPTINAYPDWFLFASGIGGLAVGNVVGDPNGAAEIIVSSGGGLTPIVRVFDYHNNGTSSRPAKEIRPFGWFAFFGSVSLAVANIDSQSGLADIVMGADRGGRSQVAVWHNDTNTINRFTAYTGSDRNAPVRVAIKHSGPGGAAQIFTAQGRGGRSEEIRRFDALGNLVDAIFEDDPDFANGFWLG